MSILFRFYHLQSYYKRTIVSMSTITTKIIDGKEISKYDLNKKISIKLILYF